MQKLDLMDAILITKQSFFNLVTKIQWFRIKSCNSKVKIPENFDSTLNVLFVHFGGNNLENISRKSSLLAKDFHISSQTTSLPLG